RGQDPSRVQRGQGGQRREGGRRGGQRVLRRRSNGGLGSESVVRVARRAVSRGQTTGHVRTDSRVDGRAVSRGQTPGHVRSGHGRLLRPSEEVAEADLSAQVHQIAIPRPIGTAWAGSGSPFSFFPTETPTSGSPTRTFTPIVCSRRPARPPSFDVPPARTTS